MTEPHKSVGGDEMDDGFWRRAEVKAEAGLDPNQLRRRASHAAFGDEPAELTAVRLPLSIRQALYDRAALDQTITSEVIRRALEQYLQAD